MRTVDDVMYFKKKYEASVREMLKCFRQWKMVKLTETLYHSSRVSTTKITGN